MFKNTPEDWHMHNVRTLQDAAVFSFKT